ncbi:MAG: amidohydrolase, partial [Saprospiraceae bacterium]|nr:amidohydrolase [Saprospiraceae bacterium]
AVHWREGEITNGVTAMRNALANDLLSFRFMDFLHVLGARKTGNESALDAVEAMDYLVNMMRET